MNRCVDLGFFLGFEGARYRPYAEVSKIYVFFLSYINFSPPAGMGCELYDSNTYIFVLEQKASGYISPSYAFFQFSKSNNAAKCILKMESLYLTIKYF